MKKILLFLFLTITIVKINAQEIDMSQMSFDPSDITKPYLGKKVIDTVGICTAVKEDLENVMSQGIKAWGNSKDSCYNHFQRVFKGEIDSKLDNLLIPYESEIQTQAKTYAKNEAENKYRRILNEARNMKSDIRRYFTLDKTSSLYEPSDVLWNLIPKVLVKLREKYSVSVRESKISNQLEKLSKDLQKELPRNEKMIIEEFIPIFEDNYVIYRRLTMREKLRTQAENTVLCNNIKIFLEKMPPVDAPECFDYIRKDKTDDNLGNHSLKEILRYRKEFNINKIKVITLKNPNYIFNDESWDWLSAEKDTNGNKIKREQIVTHFPVKDSYLVDPQHPEYKVRRLYVGLQNGGEVYAAFSDDSLKGVSDNGYIDYAIEQVLCFYELEHNKYKINDQPSYVKDCIRYNLATFQYGNTGYSYDNSWRYMKSHKSETIQMSEQYIRQLHQDHKKDNHRYTVRVDGVTFRHYIGKNRKIIILQKYVYGNYCWKLFPYSKVTIFNTKDYIINNDIYKPDKKVLTCYFIVEKYED